MNRCCVRLAERAFYRWLEDVCLDESNGAFEVRELAVREPRGRGAARDPPRPGALVRRARDLRPFLRRPGNRDCLRVLGKLEALVPAPVRRAPRRGDDPARRAPRARAGSTRTACSRATTRRNYLAALLAIAAPFALAAVLLRARPGASSTRCARSRWSALNLVVAWFFGLPLPVAARSHFFHASVPRIVAGIIVGYLPIFFIDEVWDLAAPVAGRRCVTIVVLLGSTTLLYLYVEVQRRLGDTGSPSRARARSSCSACCRPPAIGLMLTGLIGPFMAARNWPGGGAAWRSRRCAPLRRSSASCRGCSASSPSTRFRRRSS